MSILACSNNKADSSTSLDAYESQDLHLKFPFLILLKSPLPKL